MAKLPSWTWKNVKMAEDVADRLAQTFELDVYNTVLQKDPENVEILMEVGNLYTRLGRFREGLEIDQKLVGMRPEESIFHYNLACSQSLLRQLDEAFSALRRCLELGYANEEYLRKDPDLENLRQDPRFTEILESVKAAKERQKG